MSEVVIPKGTVVIGGAILLFILFLMLNPLVIVPVGYRGIATRFGALTGQVRGEGVHLRIPIIEGNKNVEVRIQKEETGAAAASKDLQTVNSTVALNFHIDLDKVIQLYQRVGEDYKSRIVDPAMQESIKASTAKFTAEELITKREAVKEDIKLALQNKLQGNGLVVDDFNIVNFEFSSGFDKAVEDKVRAEQEALASKNKLEQIKFEAEQEVAAAKGKAEAQRIEGLALKANPEVLQLRAIEQWNGVLPQYMTTGTQLPFITIR
jgi:regulator of protease activity HflC (stomatin/prohibitin superfamily)